MKKLMNSSTALTLSFALALPAQVSAQGELSNCRTDGGNNVFPCLMGERVMYNLQELHAHLDPGAAAAAAAQAEAERLAAEEAARAEAERLAAEQAARAEAERLAAEQAARAEAERLAAEQAARAEAERLAAEQAARVEAERLAAEEAARQEAERLAAAQRARADREREALIEANEQNARKAAEREEARRQARAEELAAAAAAAAAAANGTSQADVIIEDVDAAEVRGADEEFETAVTGNRSGGGGLSKFEKALLLGLGAAVVGSVLRNGDRVVSNSGDRVVVQNPNGDLRVLKDDDALLRRAGDEVRTETFNDGSSRTIVSKVDGSRIVTIRGRDGTVLRRVSIDRFGNEYVLFDDLRAEERVIVTELPQAPQTTTRISSTGEDALRAALQAELLAQQGQRFSLRQIREIRQVRALAPELELDAVRFETGSAAIRPDQARSLTLLGRTLSDLVARDPHTVILVEGHTDAVGSATYNLALSDRRAETVALALTEYFNVPPENMVTQGYGESALKVPTLLAEPANRRAVVRNITPLLR